MVHSLVVSLPSLMAFFWAATLHFEGKDGNRAKRLLSLFMVAAFLLYVCYIPFFNGHTRLFIYLLPLYTFASLMVYPMYSHYICMITKSPTFRKCYFLHYIPALLFAILMAIGILLLNDSSIKMLEKTIETNQCSYYGNRPYIVSYIYYVFLSSRIFFAVTVLASLYLNFKNIRSYNVSLSDIFSNPEARSLNNLSFILAALTATSLISFIFNIIGFQAFKNSDWLLLIPSFTLSSILYIIGLVGLKQEQVCLLNEEKDVLILCKVDTTFEAEIMVSENFKQEFESWFFDGKSYLAKDLKIWDVCEALNTNRTYVSSYINKNYSMNFCSFVNKHRAAFAKELILNSDNDIYSLNYVSEQAGFSSLNSFYRAFQKEYGISPGKYRQVYQNVN